MSRRLDAVRAVFEHDGYLEARITDIATEAGVAHGGFNAHFRSKPEILVVVMADLWSRLVVAATAPIAMAGRSAYYWYVVEGRRSTRPEAETMTRLWLRGLGSAEPDKTNRRRSRQTEGG